MDKLSQEYILSIAFKQSIDREELLLRKYDDYFPDIKDREIKETIEKFRKNSHEHIKLLKDKMIKLNIQG